jgi:sRNA-binding protein
MEGWMTARKKDVEAALVRLAETFPKTFILEKYQPHRPLKVGIAADLMGRCPQLDHRKVSVALAVYTRRVMYLRSLVAGAVRVDLDGKPAGKVSAPDAEHAAARLTGILESRKAAAVAAKGGVVRLPAPSPTPTAKVLTLKKKPVLRLAAFPRPH